MSSTRVSHIGLCVSDLEETVRFYTEALGFEIASGFLDFGDEVGDFAEVDLPVELRMQYIVKDDLRLELLAWESPGAQGTPSQARNQLGLTHLCVQVDDLEAAAARLASFGATVIERTRTHLCNETEDLKLVCFAGPDGVRVELLQRTPLASVR